jgi:hypothetical protein
MPTSKDLSQTGGVTRQKRQRVLQKLAMAVSDAALLLAVLAPHRRLSPISGA